MEKENPEGGEVFVVDNRRRDNLIKIVLLVILIVVFPVCYPFPTVLNTILGDFNNLFSASRSSCTGKRVQHPCCRVFVLDAILPHSFLHSRRLVLLYPP